MTPGYTNGMRFIIAMLAFVLAHPVLAGKDLDLKRRVPEGHVVFTGERLAVGSVAEAFVLQYPDDPEWKLSPSRYSVDFDKAQFRFRNKADHAIPLALQGKWMRAVFEVVSVAESAVEQPKGSGNWTWRLTYECDLRTLEEAGR